MDGGNGSDQAEAMNSAVLRDDDDGMGCELVTGAPYGPKSGHRTTLKHREFARLYVIHGGNASKAAKEAGYRSPTMGQKMLLNANVQAEIKRLSVTNLEAALPKIIKKTLEIALSDKLPPAQQLKACFEVMDRCGLKPKSGPLVAIQNNNTATATVNNASPQDASELIRSVFNMRKDRLAGIVDSMPATIEGSMQQLDADQLDDIVDAIDEGQGGGVAQGPGHPPVSIPPHSTEQSGSS